ncbi:MAG TPA: MerR family transcriptional regulator [Ferruginibacter sp.]|nr:MerR family transcriptional regulator [Ferruginibacter sp.]HRN80614.1 MerR family transcriptional regulator [Ferruginibacter sp.]HRO16943.1 MerR family transcriptional regulator [Ferruginibacter sp.]HRQ20594.1 MerR family transcriptional regulator [Ferruginibacter sp.]
MALKQASFNFDFEDTTPSTPPKVVEEMAKPLKPPVQEPVEVDVSVSVPATKGKGRGRLKISEMEAGAKLIDIPDDEILFQKSYYSMGAVTDMFKVNPSLIRYWENEFSILKPKKNGKGDRHFRPEDVKNLRLIYHLLRERKYTIEGAKTFLKQSARASEQFKMIESLKKLRQFLVELKTNL